MSDMRLQLLAFGPGGRWEFDTVLDPGDAIVRRDIMAAFEGTSLDAVHEYVWPVTSDTGLRLHLHAVAYRSPEDIFAEVRFANDAIYTDDECSHDPGLVPGYQKVDGLWIALNGRTLVDTRALAEAGHHIDLWDQSSLSFRLGRPLALLSGRLDRHPILNDLWAASRRLPSEGLDRVAHAILRWWSKRDARGEDHWTHSQNVGSAGASYRNYRLMAYIAWRERAIDTNTYRDTLAAAHHYVLEQFGTVAIIEGEWDYHQGRPFHLHEYKPQETFGHQRVCPFYRAAWPDVSLYQGTVQLRRGRNWPVGSGVETLGRINLPIHDVRVSGWDPDDWVGKRVIGFPCKVPGAVTFYGKNGPNDVEHDYRAHWYEPFIFTPSVFAHNQLLCLFETNRAAEWE